jgi:hypothetical protein
MVKVTASAAWSPMLRIISDLPGCLAAGGTASSMAEQPARPERTRAMTRSGGMPAGGGTSNAWCPGRSDHASALDSSAHARSGDAATEHWLVTLTGIRHRSSRSQSRDRRK